MTLKTMLLSLALLGGALQGSAAMAGEADFTIVNRTGYAIRSIYIAPAKSKTWGQDRLGDGVLENKEKRLIKFANKAQCKQSLNVVFDDDESEVEWDDFDLCKLTKITLKYNRKTGEVSADEE